MGGKSLVGTPTIEAAFYVIQHSPKISQYFPLIERAGKRNELSFTLFAKMHDRLLVNQKKEQKYVDNLIPHYAYTFPLCATL